MRSTQPLSEGSAPDSPAHVRALPARPSLEFERKQAKKLLALLRRGDPEELARVRARVKGAARRAPVDFKLADAQFAIAREYGFQSWPALVAYFTTLARHERSREDRQLDSRVHDSQARNMIARHAQKDALGAESLAAFVPRFYGRSHAEIFAAEVTMDDARLVVARMSRYPSWDVMVADTRPREDDWSQHDTPMAKAAKALRSEDLAALEDVVAAHPELIGAPPQDGPVTGPWNANLASAVVGHERRTRTEAARAMTDWVGSRIDLSPALNWAILGHMRMTPADMQFLLDRGADPEWLPPNGISVLEHVIYRCWNGEVVDLIARRVTLRKAFWIAAGLGDAKAVEAYVDEHGRLTPAARKHRPDFTAMMAQGALPSNPAAHDQTLLFEAFFVAALNQRFNVLDVLIDRGFPVDYMEWGQTILHLAVGNGWIPLVEYLIGRGANLDFRGRHPDMSAREVAEEMFVHRKDTPEARRLLELCGGRDPDTLLREHAAAQAARVMQTAPKVEECYTFAKEDAIRRGQAQVTPENVFIGLLRGNAFPFRILADAGVDLARLKAGLADRLAPLEPAPTGDIGPDEETTAALMAGRAKAETSRGRRLLSWHVLFGLLARESAAVLDLIRAAGGSPEQVRAGLERFVSEA